MKDKEDLFQNLFVFDMANNHMGDVEHGIRSQVTSVPSGLSAEAKLREDWPRSGNK